MPEVDPADFIKYVLGMKDRLKNEKYDPWEWRYRTLEEIAENYRRHEEKAKLDELFAARKNPPPTNRADRRAARRRK